MMPRFDRVRGFLAIRRAGIVLAGLHWLLFCAGAQAVVKPIMLYDIQVVLDAKGRTLTGSETIHYTSGADTALTDIYLHLYPNAFDGRPSTYKRESEEIYRDFALAQAHGYELGYLRITSLSVDDRSDSISFDDTSLKVTLSKPLAPRDSIILKIGFVTKIPAFPGRFRYVDNDFSVAQWYPKMAVYDEQGWHHDPYHLIGEFYGDFATFDVNITLPQEDYVGATGTYVNGIDGNNDMPLLSAGEDSAEQHKRVLLAKIATGTVPASKTLHFHANDVHDFAWVASSDYVKDEANRDGVEVVALVLAEDCESNWRNLLDFETGALRFFSEQVGNYPYPTLTVAEAYNFPAGGMEYPSLAMLDPATSIPHSHALEYVTVHEVGHNWFYGALANDELDDPWLDEGFAEYFTLRYAEGKYRHGSVTDLPSWANLFIDLPYRWTHEILYHSLQRAGDDPPVEQPAYRYRDDREYAAGVYSKGALLLDSLRELLGDSVLTQAIQEYYLQRKFQHVTIADFVSVTEHVSGRDLQCFFDGGLYSFSGGRRLSRSDSRRTSHSDRNPGDSLSVEIRRCRQAQTSSGNHLPVKIVRPLLMTGYIDPYHYVAGINPLIWYNGADKWRTGIGFRSGYLLNYDVINAGVSQGTGSGKTGFYANYSTAILPRSKVRFSVDARNDLGAREFTATLGRWVPTLARLLVPQTGAAVYPSFRTFVSIAYSDKYDSRYFDSKWYDLGKTAVLHLTGDYYQCGFQGVTHVNYALAKGLGGFGSDYEFSSGMLKLQQDVRLIRTGELIATVGGTVGLLSGAVPKQEQFCIANGVPSSSVDPIGQLVASGGGGVRGYQTDAVLGNQLFAAGLELWSERLSWPHPSITPLVFLDGGRVNNPVGSRYTNRLLGDAGIEFRVLNVLRLSFPLWRSEVDPGNHHFDIRLVTNLGLELP
jgi:hypothetical protein